MKREREKKITRLHIILFGLVVTTIIITVIVVNTSGNKRIEKYKKLERDLKTATTYYYSARENALEKGRMEVVTMKTIINNGYLQDEITSQCEGYTTISNYRDLDGNYEIKYDSYISCGKYYETEGYEKELITQ